jgi:hypothetical protein
MTCKTGHFYFYTKGVYNAFWATVESKLYIIAGQRAPLRTVSLLVLLILYATYLHLLLTPSLGLLFSILILLLRKGQTN